MQARLPVMRERCIYPHASLQEEIDDAHAAVAKLYHGCMGFYAYPLMIRCLSDSSNVDIESKKTMATDLILGIIMVVMPVLGAVVSAIALPKYRVFWCTVFVVLGGAAGFFTMRTSKESSESDT